jgi:VWFA-related protein
MSLAAERRHFAAGVVLAVALAAASGHAQSERDARTRTIYVTATDSKFAPVTDLVMRDFTVRQDGHPRELISVDMATMPLQIAVIVDDNGTGLFRSALARFIQRLQGRAEMSLSVVVGQVMPVVPFTTNAATLVRGLERVGARPGTPDGGQLLEGILQATRDLSKRRAARPVIVALTVGGEEHSSVPGRYVLEQLEQSGATLHVVSVAASALRSTVPVRRAADLLESNLALQQVLGDGPKQSGGRSVEIVATTGAVDGLQQIADSLVNQYVVVYSRPSPEKPNEKLAVTVNRRGVHISVPARLPNR